MHPFHVGDQFVVHCVQLGRLQRVCNILYFVCGLRQCFFSMGMLQNIHGPRAALSTIRKLILPSLATTNEYYILLEIIVVEMNVLTLVFLW